MQVLKSSQNIHQDEGWKKTVSGNMERRMKRSRLFEDKTNTIGQGMLKKKRKWIMCKADDGNLSCGKIAVASPISASRTTFVKPKKEEKNHHL